MQTVLFSRGTLRTFVVSVLGLATAAIVAACGSTEPKVPAKDVVPTAITATTSGTLSGVAGGQLATPIAVIVTNKSGQPIDSAIVTFAAAGGGSVGAASVRTNAQGQASTTWTLGSAVGAQTATATVGTLAPVTFAATATAAPAAAVAKVAGDNQTAAAATNVATAPAVRVTDQFNNPVAGVLVSFAVATGGGLVTGGAVNTGADGIARAGSWRLGNTVGTNTLTATVASLTAVTFTATATAGAVARIVITNTAPVLTAGQTFRLTANAFDATNNPIASPGIVWASGNPPVATIDASTGTITGVAAGSSLVTATVGAVSASQVVTVVGHPGGTLVANVPASSRIGGVSITGSTVWFGRSSATTLGSFSVVGVTNATVPSDAELNWKPIDVAISASGATLASVTTGTLNLLWFVNPSTRVRTDSVELPAAPTRMAMTSTGSRVAVTLNDFRLAWVDVASRTITSVVTAAGTVVKVKMVGDTSLFVGTVLGRFYEFNVATGALKRTIDTGISLVDFDVSPDGKTLFYTDGGNAVTMESLASGGLSGTVDFGTPIRGLAISPDAQELWVTQLGKVTAAVYTSGIFVTTIAGKQYLLPSTSPAHIYFSPAGDFAVVTDETANSLLILR